MNCPKCGSRWKVTDSRHADSKHIAMSEAMLAAASELVGWYTAEWVVRRRSCACGKVAFTIEVTVDDLSAMFEEGGPPTTSGAG